MAPAGLQHIKRENVPRQLLVAGPLQGGSRCRLLYSCSSSIWMRTRTRLSCRLLKTSPQTRPATGDSSLLVGFDDFADSTVEPDVAGAVLLLLPETDDGELHARGAVAARAADEVSPRVTQREFSTAACTYNPPR